MKLICGVYGYHITKEMQLPAFRLVPRSDSHAEVQKWARDEDQFHLTAVLEAESISPEQLFDFSAALSFIEHMEVIVTRPIQNARGDSFSSFPLALAIHPRHNGGGEMLMKDTSLPSRKTFLEVLLRGLQDDAFCNSTQFRILFFKCVESFLQRKQFLDTSYFLVYSALETFSRAVTEDATSQNSSTPIVKCLKQFGFDVDEQRNDDLMRSISTYTHIRNAIFHNSALEKIVKLNQEMVTLKAINYISPLSRLVALCVLKALNFDDQHINWNSWVDRQAFT